MRKFLLVLWATILFSLPAHSVEGPAAKVDPAQYQKFVALVKELNELQDPIVAKSAWAENQTKRMFQILEELQTMKGKGFILPKTDEVLRTLNRLVENMHAHCLVIACANNPGTVLLRVGKTPENLEFGGLLAEKVSDFDMTLVGKRASRARDLQLSLLNKMYGKKFAEMTMTDLSLADSTIAAWTLGDIEKAYGSAVLNPEMHRTYSGLQFVEDYVLKVGEISQLDENGKLKTMKLSSFPGPGPAKQKEQFIKWANDAFERSGHKIRFGMRYRDLCLGFVSDVSNQLWMNIEKEANRENPHNVVKKYLQRYADEIEDRMHIDLRKESAYGKGYDELQDLIHKCEAREAGAWEKLKEKMLAFEGYVRGTVAKRQAEFYNEALAAGDVKRAQAILLDTKGALQNWEILGQTAPAGALEKLGEQAAKELSERPIYLEPRNWGKFAGRLRSSVFDYATMKKYLAENKGAIFLQVGGSLFVLHDALQRESEGDKGAFVQAVKWEAFEKVMFNALPLALEFVEYRAASAALGIVGGVWGLAESGYFIYKSYLYATLRSANVEPKILARLAGITPEGNRIEGSDIITALGAPLTEEELAAPSKQPLGEFDGGKLQIWKREDGTFQFERLHPSAEKEWEANEYFIQKNWDKRELWPPILQTSWEQWRLTPAQIIAERRLNRVFEILRREYAAQSPNPGSEKIAEIDMKSLAEPFHLEEPLRFEQPVHREEIFYYWKRYHGAFLKSAVGFNDSTSVFRTEGHELEKDLAESSLRKFLETMAKNAAQSDHAREAFYKEEDPLTLEAHLKAGIKIHFDGKDVSPEEIQARVNALRQKAMNESASKNGIWIDWLKEHWKPAEFPDPREFTCKILSVDAAPDGEERVKIVCKYEVNKIGAVDFQEWQKASDGRLYKNRTDSGKLDSSPGKDSLGPFTGTATFFVTRDDEGRKETYYIKAIEPYTEKVFAQSSDIVVEGFQRSYVFEKLSRLSGPESKRNEDKSWKSVNDYKSKIEGTSVRIETRGEDNRDCCKNWGNKVLWIGPVGSTLLNGARSGIWVDEQNSFAAQEKTADSWLFPPSVKVTFEVPKGLELVFQGLAGKVEGYGNLSALDLPEARKRGVPEPHRSEIKDQEYRYCRLRGFGADINANSPERVKFLAHVQIENIKEEIVYEWVYRLGKPGEKGSPSSQGGGGAASTAGNPWGQSLETARNGRGPGSVGGGSPPTPGPEKNPWGSSLDTARRGEAGVGASPVLGSPPAAKDLTPEQILASPTPWAIPQVQAAMEEWLKAAKPPINDGKPWHYTQWGVLEGPGVTALHPDNQGMTRHQFLWEKCRRLTSADHCTLGDYIRLRLTGGSLDACKGKMPAPKPKPEIAKKPPEPLKWNSTAPLFEAKTIYGNKTIRLEELRGKTVLLSIWNPSVREDCAHFQFLNDRLTDTKVFGDHQLVILSTAPSFAKVHPNLKDFVEKLKLRIDELYPESELVDPYWPTVVKDGGKTPTTFLIDAKGRIQGVFHGSLRENEKAEREIYRQAHFDQGK